MAKNLLLTTRKDGRSGRAVSAELLKVDDQTGNTVTRWSDINVVNYIN